MGQFGGSLEPSTLMEFKNCVNPHPVGQVTLQPGCSQLDVEDVVSNLFESNAAGVTNFSLKDIALIDKCLRRK